MGHKVHPTGFRLGVIKGWQSRWYADKNYADVLKEDIAIRKLINDRLANAGISRVEIERVAGTQITVYIFTAKPGIVIGKSGEKVDQLRAALEKLTKKKINTKIQEIRTPDMEAVLVGKSIAEQLEKRVSFRRAMKQAVQKAMRAGAKGVKIICSGRLGGAEIARSEREVEGSVPLHTLRADIDFAIVEAHTTYGTIGIKVWIYKGLVLSGPRQSIMSSPPETERQPRADRGDRRGDRGDRRPRGDGDRRGPRPEGGDRRGPRPDGPRGPRPEGSGPRTPRPDGGAPRSPRPEGSGPRPPRPDGGAPRQPRADGGAPRPPRQDGEQRAPEAPVNPAPTTPVVEPATNPAPAPAPTEQPEA